MERWTQPYVMGVDEPTLLVHLQYQGSPGDSYRIEIRRSDGSLFEWRESTLHALLRYQYQQWPFPFAGTVLPEHLGTWTAAVIVESEVVMQVSFEVGETTVYAPRFFPISGRSIRMDATVVQRDTLRMSPLCEPVTFSFVDPPDFVAFEQDTIVTFAPPSSQEYRSLFFQVVATDAAALTDTFRYHVVDPTKPHAPTTGIPYARFNRAGRLALEFQNPYLAHTVIGYTVDEPGAATLRIYDVQGRLIRTLVDRVVGCQQNEQTAWDGRDAMGRPVSSGLYFYRLEAEESALTRKVIYVK
jgi:hypothetical protein